MTSFRSMQSGLRTFGSDLAQGLFEFTHSGFAMLGLAVVFVVVALTVQPQMREQGEQQLMEWLRARQFADNPQDANVAPIERATAADPAELPKQQAKVAYWLSKKYRVAPEPISALVAEAYRIGISSKLDPTLILAIMAIESGFNPFAQSPVGAQGLMQVMTKVHGDKYETAGGTLAAFDPMTNLRVGVKVLQECIKRAGSIEGGLRYYVSAANLEGDGGYAQKVLDEHARILSVASGQKLPSAPARMIPASTTSTPDGLDKLAALF